MLVCVRCQVFCALCSNLKFKLTHLDGKEGRVCVSCHSALIRSELNCLFFVVVFCKKKNTEVTPTWSPSGTPPGGKRKVCFADEILANQQSESAPTTPVRGPSLSPLMRRALEEPDKSPVGTPQVRRSSRTHRSMISVGLPQMLPDSLRTNWERKWMFLLVFRSFVDRTLQLLFFCSSTFLTRRPVVPMVGAPQL